MSIDQYELLGVAVAAILLLNVIVQLAIFRLVWLRFGSLKRDLNRTLRGDLEKVARKVIYDHGKWQEKTESLRLQMEEAKEEEQEKYHDYSAQKIHNPERGDSGEIADVRPEYWYLSAHRYWLCLREELIEAEIDFLGLAPTNVLANTPLEDPRWQLREISGARAKVDERLRELEQVPPLPKER